MFDLPETTLRRARKNGVPARRGPPTILTYEEEQEIVGYCLNMQKLGFGLTKAAVNFTIMQLLRTQGRDHPFSDGGPGQAWWARFLRDHPELSFRIPQELTEARAQRANETVIRNHFEKLAETVRYHSLTADRVWNFDETGFQISSRLEKVLAEKNSRQVHKRRPGDSQDHVTLVPTISAAGTYIPPLFIYKGVRVIPTLLEGAPTGSVMAFTESAYMRDHVFRQYVEHFVKSIPPARPVLLIMDGHKSHIDRSSVEYCHANGVILYALPPNTTHVLQPAEIPFRRLKLEYDKACDVIAVLPTVPMLQSTRLRRSWVKRIL
jgi:DDE superfamily endonuclease